jgi:hypothetical protein
VAVAAALGGEELLPVAVVVAVVAGHIPSGFSLLHFLALRCRSLLERQELREPQELQTIPMALLAVLVAALLSVRF